MAFTSSSPAHATLLTSYLEFTNTPKGLVEAYQNATKPDSPPVEKVFLDTGGFSTWFAYFLTKRAANRTTHFAGQAACKQLIDLLPEISHDDLKSLAEQVKSTIPTDVCEKIRAVYDNTIAKSRRKDDTSQPSSKRRRE